MKGTGKMKKSILQDKPCIALHSSQREGGERKRGDDAGRSNRRRGVRSVKEFCKKSKSGKYLQYVYVL
jgi:hypothetical protein